MKGVLVVKEIRAPKFANVIKYLHDNVTCIHCSRCRYHVIRGDSNYRNIAYLMAIAMKFERCVSEWE